MTRPTLKSGFWKARATVGRPMLFSSPEMLWGACLEYFDWVEDHPLMEERLFAGGADGPVKRGYAHKLRVMTLGGLCLFLDCRKDTWLDYAKMPGFSDVCAAAEAVIREQKFAGAAADLFNVAIIARDLGLVDKRSISGADGGPVRLITTDMKASEAAELWLEVVRNEAVSEALEDQRGDG